MTRRYVPDAGDLVWLTFDPRPAANRRTAAQRSSCRRPPTTRAPDARRTRRSPTHGNGFVRCSGSERLTTASDDGIVSLLAIDDRSRVRSFRHANGAAFGPVREYRPRSSQISSGEDWPRPCRRPQA